MVKNKDNKSFIGFIQWSIYTLVFFCLIIYLRITSANFDLGVITAFISGIMITIALSFLAKYENEKINHEVK